MHHSFDLSLAAKYGVEEAILIHHFQHWIRINRTQKKNFHEERTWSYQTLQEIVDHFPYWSVEDVRSILERLCTGKGRKSKKTIPDFEPVLKKGNFNKTPFDKTTWYAFCDEKSFVPEIESVDQRDSKNVYEREISQIEQGDLPNGSGLSPRPIPDTKTNRTFGSFKEKDKKESPQKTRKEPAKAQELPPMIQRGSVSMTEAQYEKLVAEYGRSEVDYTLKQLDLYSEAKPQKFKEYSNHAAVVRQWILREKKKKEEAGWTQKKFTPKSKSDWTSDYKNKNGEKSESKTFNEGFSEKSTSEQPLQRSSLADLLKDAGMSLEDL